MRFSFNSELILCLIYGADVAGGYSPSILDALRRAMDTSKALSMQNAQLQTLTFEEAFRLATLGGSEGKSPAPLLSELKSSHTLQRQTEVLL